MTAKQTTRDELNAAVKALAKLDRPAAVAILARYGALTTPQIKHEDVLSVTAAFVEACEEARAKIAGTS
jgi:hypothetical protein